MAEDMLLQTTLLSVLLIYVDGRYPNLDTLGYISTKFNSVPSSYRYTYSRKTTPNHPIAENIDDEDEITPLKPIQYAPLYVPTLKNDLQDVQRVEKKDVDKHVHNLETAEKSDAYKKHLEPRFMEENRNQTSSHKDNYRSFILGHNIAVLQSQRHNHKHSNIFRSSIEPGRTRTNDHYKYFVPKLEKETETTPLYNIIPTSTEPPLFPTYPEIRLDQHHHLPAENYMIDTRTPRYEYSGLRTNLLSRPLVHPKPSRLHLNIRRIYSVSNVDSVPLLEQDTMNAKQMTSRFQPVYLAKPKASTPYKTVLYPVQDLKRHYDYNLANKQV